MNDEGSAISETKMRGISSIVRAGGFRNHTVSFSCTWTVTTVDAKYVAANGTEILTVQFVNVVSAVTVDALTSRDAWVRDITVPLMVMLVDNTETDRGRSELDCTVTTKRYMFPGLNIDTVVPNDPLPRFRTVTLNEGANESTS